MKAKGQARHRFWGEYSAHIGLVFESRDDAEAALPILNNNIIFGDYQTACGGKAESNGWYLIEDAQGEARDALFIMVADPALEKVVDRLVEFGADRNKILSLARSIDYGEPFEIEIKIEDKNQMQLL